MTRRRPALVAVNHPKQAPRTIAERMAHLRIQPIPVRETQPVADAEERLSEITHARLFAHIIKAST